MKTPPEKFRLSDPKKAAALGLRPEMCSTEPDGCNGFFIVPRNGQVLRCMVSDGEGWEHVSVSLRHRCPDWDEMCYVKSLFWDAEETVMQLHPPQSEWVNNHSYCLHLWKPTTSAIPRPPQILVGIPGLRLR